MVVERNSTTVVVLKKEVHEFFQTSASTGYYRRVGAEIYVIYLKVMFKVLL